MADCEECGYHNQWKVEEWCTRRALLICLNFN